MGTRKSCHKAKSQYTSSENNRSVFEKECQKQTNIKPLVPSLPPPRILSCDPMVHGVGVGVHRQEEGRTGGTLGQ